MKRIGITVAVLVFAGILSGCCGFDPCNFNPCDISLPSPCSSPCDNPCGAPPAADAPADADAGAGSCGGDGKSCGG